MPKRAPVGWASHLTHRDARRSPAKDR